MNKKLQNISRNEIESTIDSWIFNERNRRLLVRRLIDGVTMERLADEFDLSTRHVNTIVRQGTETILAHIQTAV